MSHSSMGHIVTLRNVLIMVIWWSSLLSHCCCCDVANVVVTLLLCCWAWHYECQVSIGHVQPVRARQCISWILEIKPPRPKSFFLPCVTIPGLQSGHWLDDKNSSPHVSHTAGLYWPWFLMRPPEFLSLDASDIGCLLSPTHVSPSLAPVSWDWCQDPVRAGAVSAPGRECGHRVLRARAMISRVWAEHRGSGH